MKNNIALIVRSKEGKSVSFSARENHVLHVQLGHNDKCLLKNSFDEIAPKKVTLKRVGKSLYIILEGDTDPSIIIDNYYDDQINPSLMGMAEDEKLHFYILADDTNSILLMNDGALSPALLGDISSDSAQLFFSGLENSHDFSFGLYGGLAALAGALGIGVATASSNYGGGHNNNHNGNDTLLPPTLESSSFKTGEITNVSTPTLNGHGTPGNTITIYDNGKAIATVVIGQDGAWSFTPTASFNDGAHSITVTESDAAGHQSEPSDVLNFTVDTIAPGKPSLEHLMDNEGATTGEIASNANTDDKRPVFSGSGESGCKVVIYDNGNIIGETVVDSTGHWSFQPSSALAEGAHSISVVQMDSVGNVGPATEARNFSITSTLPQPAFDIITDHAGDVVGPIASGNITDDATPELTGKGEPGCKVTLYDKELETGEVKEIGSTIVDDNGNWSLIPTECLADGSHNIVIVAEDAAGNQSEPSDPINLIIDTVPAQVDIVSVMDTAGVSTGELSQGDITDDSRPALLGTGKPGGTITIRDGNRVLGTTKVQADGTWAFKPDAALVDGEHTFNVTITDLTGNTASSSQFKLTIDTSVRNVVITDDVGTQTGPLDDNGSTNDTTPTISGESDPGNTIIIYDNGVEIGTTTADASGNWSFTPDIAFNDGEHAISVKVIDPENNAGSEIPIATITVDTTVPNEASYISITGGDTPVADGGKTNDATPTLSGDAEPGSTVIIYDNGVEIGTTTADASGDWSFTPATPLPDGNNELSVVVVDPAGNTSPASDAGTVVIDTSAPDSAGNIVISGGDTPVADGGKTNDATPTLSGDAEPGSTVIIYDNGVEIGTTTADASGDWSFTPVTPLPDGNNELSVVVVDPAGNASPASDAGTITVDTSAPDSAGNIVISGGDTPVADGGKTNDATPTLSGDAEPGSTVIIYDNGVEIGTTTADASGDWSFTPVTPLPDGNNELSVVVVDPAGNTSPASDAGTVVIDTSAPDSAGNIVISGGDTPVADGGKTNDATPTLSGDAEPGSTVIIYDNGVEIGTTTADASGDWSFTPATPLPDGNNELSVVVVDPAGNASPASDAGTVVIDTSAPDSAGNIVISGGDTPVADGGKTNDATPTLSGDAEPGSTVIIYDNGVEIGTTTADASGDWSFTPATPLPDGNNELSVVVVDPAGNASPASDAGTITVDTSAPDSAGNIVISGGDTPVADGGKTNDATPTLSGDTEPGSTVIIYDNGVEIGTTTADASGDWSFTPATPLPDGNNELSVVVVDPAGNTSPASDAGTVVIDTSAPDSAGNIVISGGDTPVADGGKTNDATPTLSGDAEPGSTVIIYDNGVEIGTTTADASGDWSFTPVTPLPDGNNELSVVVVDPAGNTSPATDAGSITIDTTAPDTASSIVITDNEGNITGPISNGAVTDETQPVISGKAEAGSTVTIYDGATVIGTTTTNADGTWSFTPEEALANGNHAISVKVTDAAGNTSEASEETTFKVDVSLIPATIDTVSDDIGAQSGNLKSGDITDDSQPALSGTGAPGGDVTIRSGDTILGTTTVDANGNWTFTPTDALNDGTHDIRVTIVDALGKSATSSVFTVVVDTATPSVASDIKITDDSGTVTDGGATKDTTPTIDGKAEAGSTVVIYDNDVEIGTTTADENGNWSFTPDTALSDGTHDLDVVVVDPAGNASPAKDAGTISVDTSAPAAATSVVMTDDNGKTTGVINNGGTTDDATPTISGKAEAGSTVTVYDGSTAIGTATADANGDWSFTSQTSLNDGEHSISVTVTDPAGNTSPATDAIAITVDTTKPTGSNVVITDSAGKTVPADGETNDTTSTLSGKTEPGSTVVIYDNGVEIGTTTTDASGNWSYTPATPMSDGDHAFTVDITDLAGNTSTALPAGNVTVDTGAPATATSVIITDDVAGGMTGPVVNGATTNDTTPTISGKAEAGSTVTVYDGSTAIGTAIADANGDWSFTPDASFNDGEHSISVTVTDPAGNASPSTDAIAITVDTTKPTGSDVVITDSTGKSVPAGGETNDSTPTISGKTEPGSTVVIYDNGVEIGTTTTDASGNWSYTPATPMTDGDHAFTTDITDPSGNTSTALPAGNVTVDTSAPAAATSVIITDDVAGGMTGPVINGGMTNDTTPTISGKAEAGSTVTIYDGSTAIGTVTADSDGDWSFTPETPFSEGEHSISVTVTDLAGNTSPASETTTIVVDTTVSAPVELVITDNTGDKKGPLNGGDFTDDNQPVISGKAEAGSTVTVYDGEAAIGTAMADASGVWSFTPQTVLADGPHSITVKATDVAGNTSPATTAVVITVDTMPPEPAKEVIFTDDVGRYKGNLINNDVTDDNKPTISGKADGYSTVTIYDKGVNIGTALVNADGNWSFTPQTALEDGEHTFTTTVTDKLGRTSDASSATTIIIDTAVPDAASIVVITDDAPGGSTGALIDGATTNDNQPTISGEAPAGNTIIIYDGDIEIGTTTVDANGQWSFTPDTPLADGDHAISVKVSDAAGNTSAATDTITIKIDVTAPVAATNITIADDTGANQGSLADGNVTDDNKPTISGEAENGSTVTIYDGETAIGTVTVDANGIWSFTPDTALSDGVHNLTVRVTDAAGNTSSASPAMAITVDTTAPDKTAITDVQDNAVPVQGSVGNGKATNDTTPTLSGTAEAGSIVTIYDGNSIIASVIANGQGIWSFTPEAGNELSEGDHAFTITATDAAGNVSEASAPWAITIDTHISDAVVTITAISNDTGIDSQDFITSDDTLEIKGSLDKALNTDEWVEISLDNGTTWIRAVATGTSWTADMQAMMLPEGNYTIQARIIDNVGNVGDTDTHSLVISKSVTPPIVDNGLTTTVKITTDTFNGITSGSIYSTSATATNSDMITRDCSVTLSGTLSSALIANQYLQISLDNGLTWTTVLAGTGRDWSYQLPTASQSTTYNYQLRIADILGNVATNTNFSDNYTVVIDMSAPDAINLAPQVAKYVSSDTVFTFTDAAYGKVEAGAIVTLVNDINRNGSYQEGIDQIIGYATAGADGTWSITTQFAAGAQNLAFVVWDAAGNYSTMSSVTCVGVTDGSTGSTSIDAKWGGTTDADSRGLNAAAVTIGQNGLWSFFQSARGTSGSDATNAGRVYNAQDRETYISKYLAEPSTSNGAGYNLNATDYGHYVNSAVFADINRDGYTDVMTQISSYSNNGRTAYWMQNADGSFSPKVLDQGTLNHLGGVIAYDREGDGYLDFVLADSAADSISFIKNVNGSLTYEKASGKDNGHPGGAIPSALSILHEVGAVDIDNNGTIDITAHIDMNSKDDWFPSGSSRSMGIIYNQVTGGTSTNFGDVGYYTNVFRNDGTDDYGNLSISMTYADYNGDGWLDLFLSRGSKGGNNSDESRIYLNDGAGKLKATDAQALWFGDNMDGGTSLAVDWNHDGKMDIIEVPRQLGNPTSPTLYVNNGTNNWTGSGKSLTGGITYTNITGAVALDYDWDGSMDLLLYRAGGDSAVVASDSAAPTMVIKNTNIAADGTSLQIRIVDGNGINTFYSNTVKLYNSKGQCVSTQLINPQASGSSNSMGLVSFFGLDPNEVYSVELLRITNGQVNHVGAAATIGEFTNGTVNETWGGLVTRQAHDAYVLTAENTNDVNNTTGANGIIGTGYNDTFFSSAGDDTYNGSGGWTHLPNGTQVWSETAGLDIIDYSRAPGAVNVNLQTGVAAGHGTDKLISIEGAIGTNAADTFTDSAANNQFEGRGGNDTFNLYNGGNDTLMYHVLKGAENSADGGNGHDIVNGFNIVDTITSNNADIIDISELVNYTGPISFTSSADGTKMELDAASSGLKDYVKVEIQGNDTVISIDRDGKGAQYNEYTQILTITNKQTDLDTLLINHQLLV